MKLRKHFSILMLLSLFGCTYDIKNKKDYHDIYTNKTQQDAVDSFSDRDKLRKENKKELAKKQEKLAPIPKISNMLSFPEPPKFTQGNQIISFSVTDAIDLKDVLIELGRITGLDVDIDPEIEGGIILNAKNRPLIEVIERISKLGNLRYSYENEVLNFKKDTPYNKHYIVDYLVDGGLWDEVTGTLENIIKNDNSEDSQVSGNKAAGILTVFANDSGQKAAKQYLTKVGKTASSQVLIEAKVIEVTLTDNYNTGINWNLIDKRLNLNSPNNNPSITDKTPFTATISNTFGSLGEFTINAFQEFGTVRAISSPRLSSLNNQKATINFLNKLVYFTIESDTSASGSGNAAANQSSVTSTKVEEPIGVELEITPSIDVEKQKVKLFIKSVISVSTETVTDPAVALSLAINDTETPTDDDGNPTLTSEIPVVESREIETRMNINSGETLVIGGLMTENTTNTDTGIPFLSKLPLLGHLFKFTQRDNELVETIILIKATIIEDGGGVSDYDKEINDNFTGSRRPFL